MSDNIKNLGAKRAEKTRDNRAWSPLDCLRDCIYDVETDRTPCDKLLILRIDTKDGEVFNVGYNAANLKASEILAVLECAKAMVLQEMGYYET